MSCTQEATQDAVAVALYRGDTMRLDVTLAGAGGGPVDVTGWSWDCQLRDQAGTLAADITVTVVDAPAGLLELSLTDTETALLALGDYSWDLQATDVPGDVQTLIVGRLRVREDVTR